MVDLFAGPTPEELLNRKILTLGALINRFEEDLERALTVDPRTLSLQKASWISKDIEDIVALIKKLKKRVGHA